MVFLPVRLPFDTGTGVGSYLLFSFPSKVTGKMRVLDLIRTFIGSEWGVKGQYTGLYGRVDRFTSSVNKCITYSQPCTVDSREGRDTETTTNRCLRILLGSEAWRFRMEDIEVGPHVSTQQKGKVKQTRTKNMLVLVLKVNSDGQDELERRLTETQDRRNI